MKTLRNKQYLEENNIKLHFLNEGKRFGKYFEQVQITTYKALEQILKLISIKNLDIVIYATPYDYNIIPEIGIGGRTVNSNMIFVPIDPTYKNVKRTIEKELSDTLAHEINHAARMESIGFGESLLDGLISEGLADNFAFEMYSISHPWDKALTSEQLVNMLKKARQQFNKTNYDYYGWFFGSKDFPKWTGYTLGYQIVGNYLKTHPKEKASNIYKLKSNEFISDDSYYQNIINSYKRRNRT